MDDSPAALRDAFMHGTDPLIERRRGIVGLSIFNTCILGVIGLYQTGILKRLPPHLLLLNPEAVHGSRLAYSMGITAPDAVLGMASYTTTACLAAFGDTQRWRTRRWLPALLAAKCAADALLSTRLGLEQWKRFRTFSPWSLAIWAATCGSFVFSSGELAEALRHDAKGSRSDYSDGESRTKTA